MDQKQITNLRLRAEAEFKKIPGVVGVGFGLKEIGGKLTEGQALRVYVVEKKTPDELSTEEIIPSEFEGIPTDVIRLPRGTSFGTEDTQRHSPLIGGITISNLKSAGGSVGIGTLGFFATIDGASGPDNVVCVTNNHVLDQNGAVVGDTIYQPAIVSGAFDSENKGPIGVIHNIGTIADRSFAYPGDPGPQPYFVDTATGKLNISISSWCNSNCGVSYKNELRELNISGNSKLEGVARAVSGGDVFKSGRKTGATKGVISDPNGMMMHNDLGIVVNNVIIMQAVAPDPRFSDEGDSGSAVLNDQNELIGLLYGGNDDTPPLSFACHIHPVLDSLSVTPISTQNPPVGPAGHARSDRPGVIVGEDKSLDLRDRALATRRGTELHGAFIDHRDEIVALVNHHRRVTVAWHRGKGPAYIAHLSENARHPSHRIPFEIEGVTRRGLIERMADVLGEAGSPNLQAAIAQYRPEVLQLIDQFDDLHELVGRFQEATADA